MPDMFDVFPVLAALITENDLYFFLLVVAAVGLGLYIRRFSGDKKDGRAERLMKEYKTLDRAALDSIPGDRLVDAVIANLMAKLNTKNPDDYSVIPLLSRGRCAVYSIWLTCNQLNAAGLAGYLGGRAGRFAELSADGLELVGAQQTSRVIREILDARTRQPQNLPLLEEELKNAIAQERPLELCREYIRANPDEFLDV